LKKYFTHLRQRPEQTTIYVDKVAIEVDRDATYFRCRILLLSLFLIILIYMYIKLYQYWDRHWPTIDA